MDSENGSAGAETVMAVERAADILRLFINDDDGDLGVTEIARALELSKAVVHRILASLRAKGFVRLDQSTRRYRLGTASLLVGLAALEHLDVRELARPALEELSARTNETATLSMRSGHTRIYIDQVTPDREVRMSVRIGHPWPLHAGASSKAFLAFMEDADIDRYLESESLGRITTQTITSPQAIRKEIAQIRRLGYAKSIGERQAGAASVAAPLFDHQRQVVGVMSVCGPAERFAPIAAEATQLLLAAARAVSERLGCRC